jgi:GntR family transcriptional regulator/MocR family aminotransferase
VIYIGTFSKVLFPAVRIGYLVVPRPLVQRFLDARAGFDLFSATLYQLALTTFIDDGHFARHLRRMRGIYGARREALLAALERHCGALVAVHNADAGLHVAVTFADGQDDRRVARVMGERGLTATALSSCYAEARPRSGLLLGFGGWSPRRIAEATRLLGDVLQADQTTRRRVRST